MYLLSEIQFSVVGMTDEFFLQYMADNVGHIACTLNELNTFHGIGIIATITPRVNSSIIIPKEIVSMDSLIQIGGNRDKIH